MADAPILNRQQLSQFLPNHEAIKAFEALFKYVSSTAPEIVDDISSIIASMKTPAYAISDALNRIDAIEQQQRKLNSTYGDISNRLDFLEQTVSKKFNSDDVLKRLQNLESIIGI